MTSRTNPRGAVWVDLGQEQGGVRPKEKAIQEKKRRQYLTQFER